MQEEEQEHNEKLYNNSGSVCWPRGSARDGGNGEEHVQIGGGERLRGRE